MKKSIGAVILSMAFLGGCSKQDDKLVLGIWTTTPQEMAFVQERVDSYEQSTGTEVQIEVINGTYNDAIQLQIASGGGPDVFYMDSLYLDRFVNDGAVQDIKPFLKKTDLNDFNEPLLAAYQKDDAVYGLPKDANSLVLYYDQDTFNKYNMKVPANWDELLKTAHFFADLDKYDAGIVLETEFPRFSPFLFQSGGKVFDEKGNFAFNSAEVASAYDFYYRQLLGSKAAKTGQELDGNETAFTTKRVPMMISGGWAVQTLEQESKDLNWKMAKLPAGKEQTSMLFTVAYVMNANTEKTQESVDFIEYMASEKIQRMVVDSKIAVPTRKAAGEYYQETNKDFVANSEQFAYSNVNLYGVDGAKIHSALGRAGEKIYINNTDVEQALEEALLELQ
ncbi:ABC transporter substrate-binding protein [Psychromonas ossibalaenae]|uniref:ABC transporter substrate-binding protein n=1 Tax=Psychromonas ossibalaenae TaxID=444922 RepID=UPI000375CB15|nr:sugar ABC transporter substrate-binding protein [Psychromonas ossibalaenae]